ncbi:glutamate racemase [Algibacter amylolyticus]|uniref:Glutamate racemase n=1 Tax=Algibacter amylolyticus TaxID=1608400 RepID=A0A5M7BFY1_9FLAO|nr:glutamate racemase [Algibacter amylolyticus]KAA5827853.1 glutamate racemase [Algibacter amylolyticus]MBB5267083.1 glutamate racemase [Algibacter amylolyticus]TSJ82098.1 glutamate racemase [Algibacter amylolyticus]
MSKQAIGIFDSGVGGTSIWKEIHALLPHEHTMYLADSINAPYGPKGKEAILALSIKNTEYLLSKDCKLIVVACNTATTNAITYLRAQYNVPIIGIEPAIKPAALQTQTHAVGILATKGTLSSALFSKTATLFAKDVTIVEQIGDGIVELIEAGKLHTEAMKLLLKDYLEPMIKANIDYLVLGCTHYPYLMPILLELLPKHVKIIDSGEAVARQTKAVLKEHNLLNNAKAKSKSQFFTNGNPEVMKTLLGNGFNVSYLDF